MQIKNQLAFLKAKQASAAATGDPRLAEYYEKRERSLRTAANSAARQQLRMEAWLAAK